MAYTIFTENYRTWCCTDIAVAKCLFGSRCRADQVRTFYLKRLLRNDQVRAIHLKRVLRWVNVNGHAASSHCWFAFSQFCTLYNIKNYLWQQ